MAAQRQRQRKVSVRGAAFPVRGLPAHLRVAAGVALALALGVGPAEAACEREPGPTRAVARVIDGETIALDDGREVRLAALLAPRASDVAALAGTWPFELQARAVLTSLLAGETATLEYAGRRTDRYGRLLAHVFVEKAGERIWVEERLILQGLARAHGSLDNPSCLDALLAAEARARALRIGIWGSAAYRVRRPGRRSGLVRDRATYQLVEGKVHRAVEARGMITIYVGERPGDDLVVRVPRSRRALALSDDEQARDLVGKLVRVRGWLEGERSPLIEIVHAGQLERIERLTPGQGRRAVPRAKRSL